MPVEVEHHRYLYGQKEEVAPVPHVNYKARIQALKKTRAARNSKATVSATKTLDQRPHPSNVVGPVLQPRAEPPPDTPFRYNPLHDLESIFWLALYLLLTGTLVDVGEGGTEVTTEHRQAQHQLSNILFCDLAFRMTIMKPGVLQSHLANLHPRIAEIAKLLDGVRSHLTSAFVKSEENLKEPIPFTVAESTGAYGGILEKFEEIINLFAVQDISVAVYEESDQQLRGALSENSEVPQDDEVGHLTKKRKLEAEGSDPFAIAPVPSSSSNSAHFLEQGRLSG